MKLIIHIGLPKTASTTLQRSVFEKVTDSTYVYLGKCSEGRKELAFEYLCDAIYSRSSCLDQNRSRRTAFQNSLQKYQGKTVLISEEMFAIDTLKSTWQEKLKKLAYMVDGLDVEMIVVVREPYQAIYSLFVEVFHTLPRSLRCFDTFLNSNQAKLYDYLRLDDWLKDECGMRSVHYLTYENIVSDKETLNYKYLQAIFRLPSDMRLSPDTHHNKKVKLNDGILSSSKTLSNNLSNTWPVRFMRKHIDARYYSFLAGMLNKVKVKNGDIIPYPEKLIRVRFYEMHSSNLRGFFARTGILYDGRMGQ